MRLKTPSGIYSILILSIAHLFLSIGCAQLPGIPERPDSVVYQVIVTEEEGSELFGYNVRDDYDFDGEILPGAVPKVIPLTGLKQLRGWYCTDKTGMKRAKVYRGSMTKWVKEHYK